MMVCSRRRGNNGGIRASVFCVAVLRVSCWLNFGVAVLWVCVACGVSSRAWVETLDVEESWYCPGDVLVPVVF